ncbi:Exostosin family protein [Flavobacterium sp. 9AF]|uniref:exostosin domain-containing protein n=1 Tax=Flavobacterium sp. 9AF TaxID=2653142 RepID=UPI0012F230B4|nr:exostosin family protein [Flavobacterium sp. 9AF]VXC31667.1 Exostosin family protein [Flavobacterium sp. 9AF]
MKIFIAHKNIPIENVKNLFILVRPFYSSHWKDDYEFIGMNGLSIYMTSSIKEADIILLPFSINYYLNTGKKHLLLEINTIGIQENKMIHSFVSDDFGPKYPEFSNIIYYRMSGFYSKLSKNNKGFPVALSDHFQRFYTIDNPIPKSKNVLPIVGFCGHATRDFSKRNKEIIKCIIENIKRFVKNPFNRVYEPLFASAYERATVLEYLENSALIKTNFIFRSLYRGGAKSVEDRLKTTLEYYNNINESDYVLCIRGAGNFSVRFYETLMMGKIPIFVNTDCLLPFNNKINWKKHVVWLEWKDRKNIAKIVSGFHSKLSDEDFIKLQLENRKLWKETLSIEGMLEMISNDI